MTILAGIWTLKAVKNQAAWQQRVSISGSSNRDGAYPMVIGSTIVDVTGELVSVSAQSLNPVTGQWVESVVKDVMSWSDPAGVIITLYCDDNPAHADGDFDDLVVECVSADPALQAPTSPNPRLDFTIPERFLRRK